jgi:hypothetical protein
MGVTKTQYANGNTPGHGISEKTIRHEIADIAAMVVGQIADIVIWRRCAVYTLSLDDACASE